MRFRHLLYDRKFTIEGAKKRMWEELGAADPDIAARFAQIRSDLIEALMTARRRVQPAPHEGEAMVPAAMSARSWTSDRARSTCSPTGRRGPKRMRQRLLEDLSSLDLAVVQELRAAHRRLRRSAATPTAEPPDELAPAPYVPLVREQDRRGGTRGRRGGNPPRTDGLSHRGRRPGITAGIRRSQGHVPRHAAAEAHPVRAVRGEAPGRPPLVRRATSRG